MGGEAALEIVKKMPRLEELHLLARGVDTGALFKLKTLDRLRVLRIYHMNRYPLEALARNPAFARLTHLLLHPHAYDLDVEPPYITRAGVRAVLSSPHLKSLTHLRLRLTNVGDRGCKEIVESGILKRLKVLDLAHGCAGDAGAKTLAACPDLRNLELLDLTRNQLTVEGIKALKATGVKLKADHQHEPQDDMEDADEHYFYDGDIE